MIVKIGGCLIMLAIAAVVIWLLFLVSPVLLPIAFAILAIVAWVKNNE